MNGCDVTAIPLVNVGMYALMTEQFVSPPFQFIPSSCRDCRSCRTQADKYLCGLVGRLQCSGSLGVGYSDQYVPSLPPRNLLPSASSSSFSPPSHKLPKLTRFYINAVVGSYVPSYTPYILATLCFVVAAIQLVGFFGIYRVSALFRPPFRTGRLCRRSLSLRSCRQRQKRV